MPASRVTSRRLSAEKLRSSSSVSAAADDRAAGGLLALLAREAVRVERDRSTGSTCAIVNWAYDCSLM